MHKFNDFFASQLQAQDWNIKRRRFRPPGLQQKHPSILAPYAHAAFPARLLQNSG
jgi:hypothetical protein